MLDMKLCSKVSLHMNMTITSQMMGSSTSYTSTANDTGGTNGISHEIFSLISASRMSNFDSGHKPLSYMPRIRG